MTGSNNYLALTAGENRLVPIYKVDRDDKKIALTLDGTWGAEYTEQLLNLFKNEDVKVTFFFAGYWLKKYPDLVKKIAAAGHEIGNHTFTHPHLNQLSKDEIIEELESTSDLIYQLTGKRPELFRPPYGEYNNRVVQTVRNAGYQIVQWSLDSHDWREPGVDYIYNRVKNNISSGDIILMHNNAPDTLPALEKLIPELKKEFELVHLSELIYKNNYKIYSHNGLQVNIK